MYMAPAAASFPAEAIVVANAGSRITPTMLLCGGFFLATG
jgi:hypothetical protein